MLRFKVLHKERPILFGYDVSVARVGSTAEAAVCPAYRESLPSRTRLSQGTAKVHNFAGANSCSDLLGPSGKSKQCCEACESPKPPLIKLALSNSFCRIRLATPDKEAGPCSKPWSLTKPLKTLSTQKIKRLNPKKCPTLKTPKLPRPETF